jgi:hypothetical protein
MQAENHQLRQQLNMQQSSTKEKSNKMTQTAPIGTLLSTDAMSPDNELEVNSVEIAVQAFHSGTDVPIVPVVPTTRKKRSNAAKFYWSNKDDITLLNTLIGAWKEWEDPNERPRERDLLSTVNSRCGNRFPKTIRHHLNGLIKKYGGKKIKDAKKNFTEYKALLAHIRDTIQLLSSKSEESELRSTME